MAAALTGRQPKVARPHMNAKCRDVHYAAAIGGKAEVTGNRQTDALDPERSSASEQPNPSYAWPHAMILSSVLVMRSSAFITVALATKL